MSRFFICGEIKQNEDIIIVSKVSNFYPEDSVDIDSVLKVDDLEEFAKKFAEFYTTNHEYFFKTSGSTFSEMISKDVLVDTFVWLCVMG